MTGSDTRNAAVVLAHGLWMTGLESKILRQRLSERFDLDIHQFSYHSVRLGIDENADQLHDYLQSVDGDTLHLVGHSLGGLVILNMLHRYTAQRPGRIVCLGTPFLGCRSAEGLAKWNLGVKMMGSTTVEDFSAHGIREWRDERDLGVIAGSRGIGLGHFFNLLDQPHDGTVSVTETQLPGITDHIVLPVSHSGMLFSQQVAIQSAYFLKRGHFQRQNVPDSI